MNCTYLNSLIAFLAMTTILVVAFACGTENTYNDGKALYTQHCGGCHGENGEGLKALVPPLVASQPLSSPSSRASIPCTIIHGKSGVIVVNGKEYNEKMPALPLLTPVDITNIINYITHSWGAKMDPIQLQEVKTELERCN